MQSSCAFYLGVDGREENRRWWREGSGPPRSEVSGASGHQALSQGEETGRLSLKLCPACFFLTHYVISVFF